MSLVEDEKIDDLGQEVEVKVEEVFINLDYVKQELDEEVLDFEEGDKVNQNEIPLKIEKVFSTNSLKEEVDSLPNDIIVEETVIKSEEIIEETDSRTDDNNFYCELCERPYEGYCSNCSILYIINNIVPHLNSESNLKTIPTDILQIRDILRRKGVFALRTIPKGVTFGPFEGISAVENTNGHVWKIKDYKFANDENANWMKYVICGTSQLSVNLDIFQFDANLYFQTNREINYGEELLLHFGEAVMLKLNNEEEYFLAPEEKEEFPKVFACTFCCLGFRLERYLMGHKTKCPYQKHNMNIEEFEVIECCYCKMWLEKQEYLTHHMVYCLDNYNRVNRSPTFKRSNINEVDKIRTCEETSTPNYEVANGSYSSGRITNLTGVDTELVKTCSKGYECPICKKIFSHRYIKQHIKVKHSQKKEDYKCPECSFQTHYKGNLTKHINTHVKPYQCDICNRTFSQKQLLRVHTEGTHSGINERSYKCSECPYQTNYTHSLKKHLNTHVKPYHCGICEKTFSQSFLLKVHIEVHPGTNTNDYKCSKCSYQANYKSSLNSHINKHVKPYQCGSCEKAFSESGLLDTHTKLHAEVIIPDAIERNYKYKCSECPYQTNYKENLKEHTSIHQSPLKCEFCKITFSQRCCLVSHIKTKHLIYKSYKCPKCSFQTRHKSSLKHHLYRHNNIKRYQCDICKKLFKRQCNLNVHIQAMHSETRQH